jgi:3-phosphoshikimate 1-carboxyvinyltransferase
METGFRPRAGGFFLRRFPACAAVVSGGDLSLLGLDPGDTQGDKFFFEMLARMGCSIRREQQHPPDRPAGGGEQVLRIFRPGPLKGGTFDMNAVPDLLPAAAVTAACAEGDTALVNAAHARIKETDRIAVMAAELANLGVRCTERPDGLVIHGRTEKPFRGGAVDGRGDHRIVMALAAGACGAAGPVDIAGAESAAVTYPGFLELLNAEILGD